MVGVHVGRSEWQDGAQTDPSYPSYPTALTGDKLAAISIHVLDCLPGKHLVLIVSTGFSPLESAYRNMLKDILKIEKPIIQAPMAGAAGPKLVAAVANAGGFGVIPLWHETSEQVRDGIGDVRKLTDRGFAVNLNLSFPYEDKLDVCIEEGVFAVSLFWGDACSATKKAKDNGLTVLVSVGSAAEAEKAVACGADVIVTQGWESGGHVWGSVATLALVPAVVDAVGDTPVVAAGGIADARGLAAVMMLGAQGAWIGTRFLASHEATVHPTYREKILQASESQTAWAHDLYDISWPDSHHRTLRNHTFEAWEAAGNPAPGNRPNEGVIVGHSHTGEPVLNYQCYTPRLGSEGDIEAMSLWSGQGVAMVREIQPASQIVDEITAGAERIIRAASSSF